jgi:hypothetical protein
MRGPRFAGSLSFVNDAIELSPDRSREGRLYGGTVVWLVASFALGWLPLLWINNWTPRNPWSAVLLTTLFVILGVATIGWWFLVGWCFALSARLRRNAIVLGALVGATGIVVESGIQLSGSYGAIGSDDPGIGYVLIVPFIPVFVAIPILLIAGAGFYIHAFRVSRAESSSTKPAAR